MLAISIKCNHLLKWNCHKLVLLFISLFCVGMKQFHNSTISQKPNVRFAFTWGLVSLSDILACCQVVSTCTSNLFHKCIAWVALPANRFYLLTSATTSTTNSASQLLCLPVLFQRLLQISFINVLHGFALPANRFYLLTSATTSTTNSASQLLCLPVFFHNFSVKGRW